MATSQTPRTPSLNALQPEDGRVSLADYLHSDAFRQAAGLTGEGERRLLSDDDGQPLLLWHGSSARFDEFDFARAGGNTGLVEYFDKNRGEKVEGDSARTMFFTDNREAAVSYAFLSRSNRLSEIATYLTDIRVFLRSSGKTPGDLLHAVHSLDDLKKAFAILREEGDGELNAILDEVDLTAERPISRLDRAKREELLSRLDPLLKKYRNYHDMNRSGGISNRLNNFVRMKSYLEYFERNIGRLRNNDASVLTEFDEDFTRYNQSFYGPDGNSNVFVSFDPDEKRMKANGRHLDEMSDADIGSLLAGIKRDLNANIRSFNRDIEEAGYLKNTVLYPVVLKAGNPLSHDYQGSSFPDKYKPNEKYDTAYIVARQVRKAIKDGNDAVIYQNIRDPFNQTTYGVFSADQIHIIPDHVQGLDRSPLLEEIDERPLREQENIITDINLTNNNETMAISDSNNNRKSPSVIRYHSGNWTRAEAEAHPHTLYVFTDNTDRDSGRNLIPSQSKYAQRYPGEHHYPTMTAAVLRGLDNAVPVSTQRWYHDGAKGDAGRWTDDSFEEFKATVDAEFKVIEEEWITGDYSEIMFPENGLFNGRISAITKERTPQLYDYLQSKMASLSIFIENNKDKAYTMATDNNDVRKDTSFNITFTESQGGYQVRTRENAQAADVDLTFQFKAVDSPGEKATEKAAGDRLVSSQLPITDGVIDCSRENIEKAAQDIIAALPERFRDGETCRVNLAGNGIYTLNSNGMAITQEDLDVYLNAVFASLKQKGFNLSSLRSGGQTGVDESAAAIGYALSVPVTIHAPKGWKYRDISGTDGSDEYRFKERYRDSVKDYEFLKGAALDILGVPMENGEQMTEVQDIDNILDPINIYAGAGEHPELSNFAIRPFASSAIADDEGRDMQFQSVEQAYQFSKTLFSSRDAADPELVSLQRQIMATTDGGILRNIGRAVPQVDVASWDARKKDLMRGFIRESFAQNPEAQKALLATGKAPLTHTQDNSSWREDFPKILMEVRASLSENLDAAKTEDRDPEPIEISPLEQEGITATNLSGDALRRRNDGSADICLSFGVSDDNNKVTDLGSGKDIYLNLPADIFRTDNGMNNKGRIRDIATAMGAMIRERVEGMSGRHDTNSLTVSFTGCGIGDLMEKGLSQDDADNFAKTFISELRRQEITVEDGICISHALCSADDGMELALARALRANKVPVTVSAPYKNTTRTMEGELVENTDEEYASRLRDVETIAGASETVGDPLTRSLLGRALMEAEDMDEFRTADNDMEHATDYEWLAAWHLGREDYRRRLEADIRTAISGGADNLDIAGKDIEVSLSGGTVKVEKVEIRDGEVKLIYNHSGRAVPKSTPKAGVNESGDGDGGEDKEDGESVRAGRGVNEETLVSVEVPLADLSLTDLQQMSEAVNGREREFSLASLAEARAFLVTERREKTVAEAMTYPSNLYFGTDAHIGKLDISGKSFKEVYNACFRESAPGHAAGEGSYAAVKGEDEALNAALSLLIAGRPQLVDFLRDKTEVKGRPVCWHRMEVFARAITDGIVGDGTVTNRSFSALYRSAIRKDSDVAPLGGAYTGDERYVNVLKSVVDTLNTVIWKRSERKALDKELEKKIGEMVFSDIKGSGIYNSPMYNVSNTYGMKALIFPAGTMLGEIDISGMSLYDVFHKVVRRSAEGVPSASNTITHLSDRDDDGNFVMRTPADYAEAEYNNGLWPLVSILADRSPATIEAIRKASLGRPLIDDGSQPSLARALEAVMKGQYLDYSKQELKQFFSAREQRLYNGDGVSQTALGYDLLTLGVGSRSRTDFFNLIPKDVDRVVIPSHYKNAYFKKWGYSAEEIERAFADRGIHVVHVAGLEPRTFTEKTFDEVLSRDTVLSGMARLEKEVAGAKAMGKRCLMLGYESNPVYSTRLRMHGQYLERHGVHVGHIDTNRKGDGRIRSTEECVRSSLGRLRIIQGDFTGVNYNVDGSWSLDEMTRVSEPIAERLRRERVMTGRDNYDNPVKIINEKPSRNAPGHPMAQSIVEVATRRCDFLISLKSDGLSKEAEMVRNLTTDIKDRRAIVVMPLEKDNIYSDTENGVVDQNRIARQADIIVGKIMKGKPEGAVTLGFLGSNLAEFECQKAVTSAVTMDEESGRVNSHSDIIQTGIMQDDVNAYASALLREVRSGLEARGVRIAGVVTNGQSGSAEAATIAAQGCGIPATVYTNDFAKTYSDLESLEGKIYHDEAFFGNCYHMGLRNDVSLQTRQEEVAERNWKRYRRDGLDVGLSDRQMLLLYNLDYSNTDIVDMAERAFNENRTIITDDDLYDFVSLARSNGMDSGRDASFDEMRQVGRETDSQIKEWEAEGISFVTINNGDYPSNFKDFIEYDRTVPREDGTMRNETVKRPALIFYKGDISLLGKEAGVTLAQDEGTEIDDEGFVTSVDPKAVAEARLLGAKMAQSGIAAAGTLTQGPQKAYLDAALEHGGHVVMMKDDGFELPRSISERVSGKDFSSVRNVAPMTFDDDMSFEEKVAKAGGLALSLNAPGKKAAKSDRHIGAKVVRACTDITAFIGSTNLQREWNPLETLAYAAESVFYLGYGSYKASAYIGGKVDKKLKDRKAEKLDLEDLLSRISSVYGSEDINPEERELMAAKGDVVNVLPQQARINHISYRDKLGVQRRIYIVGEKEKAIADLLKKKYGDDVQMIPPTGRNAVINDLEKGAFVLDGDTYYEHDEMAPTGLQRLHTSIGTEYLYHGELYSFGDVPEGAMGLPSRSDRQRSEADWKEFVTQVSALQRRFQKDIGYEGPGQLRMENALYLSVSDNAVLVCRGDDTLAKVSFREGVISLRNEISSYDDYNMQNHMEREAAIFSGDISKADRATLLSAVHDIEEALYRKPVERSLDEALATREDIDAKERQNEGAYAITEREDNFDIAKMDVADGFYRGTLVDLQEMAAAEGTSIFGKDAARDEEMTLTVMGNMSAAQERMNEIELEVASLRRRLASFDAPVMRRDREETMRRINVLCDERADIARRIHLFKSFLEGTGDGTMMSVGADGKTRLYVGTAVAEIDPALKEALSPVEALKTKIAKMTREVSQRRNADPDFASTLECRNMEAEIKEMLSLKDRAAEADVERLLANKRGRTYTEAGLKGQITRLERKDAEMLSRDAAYVNSAAHRENLDRQRELKGKLAKLVALREGRDVTAKDAQGEAVAAAREANRRIGADNLRTPFANGLAVAEKDGRFYLVDENYRIRSNGYDSITPVKGSNVFSTEQGGFLNLITAVGRELLPAETTGISEMKEGICVVKVGEGSYNLFNMSTQELLLKDWAAALTPMQNGFATFLNPDTKTWNWVDDKGGLFCEKGFEFVMSFDENGTAFVLNETDGVGIRINKDHEVLSTVPYTKEAIAKYKKYNEQHSAKALQEKGKTLKYNSPKIGE